jgi:hypothetical protein
LDAPQIAQQDNAHGHDQQRDQAAGLDAVAAGGASTCFTTFAQLPGRLYP